MRTLFAFLALMACLRSAPPTQVDYYTQVKNKSVIYVKDYPFLAKGDGITNDRAAIQAALNACPVGGTVGLPTGQYLLSSCPAGQCLLIDHVCNLVGEGISFATGPGGSQLLLDPSVPSTTHAINVRGSGVMRGMRLSNFSIVPASGNPGQCGVGLDTSSVSVLGDRQVSYSTFDHLWIGAVGGYSMCWNGSLSLQGWGFNNTIEHNNFSGVAGGLSLNYQADSFDVNHNSLSSLGTDLYVNLVDGSGNDDFNHNTLTGSGRAVFVGGGIDTKYESNFHEPQGACVPGPNGALLDIEGSNPLQIRGMRVRDNILNMVAGCATYGVYAQVTSGLQLQNYIGLADTSQTAYNISDLSNISPQVILNVDGGSGPLPTEISSYSGSALVQDFSLATPTQVSPWSVYNHAEGGSTSALVVAGNQQIGAPFEVRQPMRSLTVYVPVGGAALNDVTGNGRYYGGDSRSMCLRVSANGAKDTYDWGWNVGVIGCAGVSYTHTGVVPYGAATKRQYIVTEYGISFLIAAPTGHAVGDVWYVYCQIKNFFNVGPAGQVTSGRNGLGFYVTDPSGSNVQTLLSDDAGNIVVGCVQGAVTPCLNVVVEAANGQQRARFPANVVGGNAENDGIVVLDHVGSSGSPPTFSGTCTGTNATDTAGTLSIAGAGTCTITFRLPYQTIMGCGFGAYTAGVNPVLTELSNTTFAFTTASVGLLTYNGCTNKLP